MGLVRRLRRVRPDAGPPAPFVVGVPRSGTTLLRLMLDAHPAMAIPPETHFVPELIGVCRRAQLDREAVIQLLAAQTRWAHFELSRDDLRRRLPASRPVEAAEALRAFYQLYAGRHGKPRWGDKTPGYLRHMETIQGVLPEARFVHIVRDPRDVALSMTEMELTGPDSVGKAARRWAKQVSRARSHAGRVRHYLEIRYEDLVLAPEPVLRQVCDFIALPWEGTMLEYHRHAAGRIQAAAQERPRPGKAPIPAGYTAQIHALTSRPPVTERVGRWRTEMNLADQRMCEEIAGDLLGQLGYERGAGDRAGSGS